MPETLDTLADRYRALLEVKRELDLSLFELESEIVAAMEADRSEVYDNGHLRLTLERRVEYDQAELDRLREYLDPGEAEQYMTPARMVPARWNGTKLRPLFRTGGDVRAIIESSRREGPARLKVGIPKARG